MPLTDNFWGSLAGALIAGIVAVFIMIKNFKHDRKLQEISRLHIEIKSANLLLTGIDTMANYLESLEYQDYPKTEGDMEAIYSGLRLSHELIFRVEYNDLPLEISEEYSKILRIVNFSTEAALNSRKGIDDTRANGLLDYASQLRETAHNLNLLISKKQKRLKDLDSHSK
ncbi:hypothetical protein [Shouchella clausii]|uniref:hypothetical protein n=1 Tax=Shouchella clausii TaxID=79880 RepID=UPI000BA78443|nr:hypothetical protein [Shouchella clausii]PAD17391.1 hypothetical protein CHH74_01840 [Shouchella clausii]